MSAPAHDGDLAEGASECRAEGGLIFGRICHTDTRPEPTIPAGYQGTPVFPSLPETCEYNRSRKIVDRRIGTGWVEVRILVSLQIDRRARELVAQTQVQCQPRG